MSEWCSYFAFDVITDLVFGKARNLLGSQQFQCVSRWAGREVVQGYSRDEAISSAGQWHDGGRGEFVFHSRQSVRESLPGNLSTAYEKLAHKIWSVFPTPDDIRSSQSMQRCTYFQACIKETLRNSPAMARCPYRPVEKGDTIIVDGHNSTRVLRRYKQS
ncbi:hypothetical protein ABHI18_003663 [Aspergillus niger]